MKILISALIATCLTGFPGKAANRTMEKGDENRERVDWNWRLPNNYQIFACDAGSVKEFAAKTPFFTHGNILHSYNEPDMHPEDGWILVHRDFGTRNSAQVFPFFTLYNRYRGIFRIMLYNAANREGSYFLGELSFLEGTRHAEARSGLFTFADNKQSQCALDEYDAALKLTACSAMTAYDSWAVFDFNLLGFDPELEKRDVILAFRLTSIDKQTIKMETTGNVQLMQTVEQRATASPSFLATAGDIYATGRGLFEAGQKGYAKYKSVESFLNTEIKSEEGRKRHQGAFWYQAMSELAHSPAASYVPYVAALSSVLECFVGGANRAAEWEPLNFSGQFSFDTAGTLQSSRDLWCHNFFLKAKDEDQPRAHRPLREVAWGIFNFQETPTIVTQEHPYSRANYNSADISCKLVKGPHLVLNPKCGMDLVSVRVAFVKNDLGNESRGDRSKSRTSRFMSVEEAMANGHRFDGRTGLEPNERMDRTQGNGYAMTGLLWELKFKVKQPVKNSDSEIIVMKRTGFIDQKKVFDSSSILEFFRNNPMPFSQIKI